MLPSNLAVSTSDGHLSCKRPQGEWGLDPNAGSTNTRLVPELFFSGPAQEGLRRLESEATLAPLVTQVNESFDLIEQHPGSAEARRLRFVDPPSWGIPVGYREYSYVVTWMSGEGFAAWADAEDVSALAAEVGDDPTQWAVVLYIDPRPE